MLQSQNPAVAAQLAQKLSDEQLAQAAQGALPTLPPYVAASEMMRRKDLRSRMAPQQQGQDRTVLEDLLDGQQINPEGIGSLPEMSSPQPSVQGEPQPPVDTQQASAPPGYAAGGLVAFDDGGAVYGPAGGFSPEFLRQHILGSQPRTPVPGVRFALTPQMPPARVPKGPTEMDSVYSFTEPEEPPPPVAPYAQSESASSRGIMGVPMSIKPTEFPEYLRETPHIGSLEEYLDERRALMPEGTPYEKLAAEAAKLGGEVDKRRGQSVGEALLQAGAAMASSKSPYFMSALGEGATAGLKTYQESRKDVDALDKMRINYEATVEQAQRAEQIGDIDSAFKLRKEAQDLYERWMQAKTTYAASDISSQRSLAGQLATGASYRQMAHDDRQASMRVSLWNNAYNNAKSILKDDPKSMMMSDEQKEQVARRMASQAVDEFSAREGWQRSGGVASLPQQQGGKVRGRLDSSGNLVQ